MPPVMPHHELNIWNAMISVADSVCLHTFAGREVGFFYLREAVTGIQF